MKTLIVILFLAIPFAMSAQMTYIPDDNFEQALIDLGYDSGPLNDSVPTKNIDTVKYLHVDRQKICDLTGIEDFIELKSLVCQSNLLTRLDMSNNISLKGLFCSSNQLTNLEVCKNVNLEWLYCYKNQLTSLNLSNNLVLENLFAMNNPNLTCIQVKDSSIAANNSNWQKDATAIYSEDCSTVGVDEGIDVSGDFSISPNPASDYIEINVGNRHACSLQENLKIYNALGECVMTVGVQNFEPLHSKQRINISSLASGIFFVTFGDKSCLCVKY